MPPTVLAGEVLRAAAAGDAREVKKLLKRNAPVVFPALIAGVQGGHADVVALLAASPDINVNACLANGCSPLFTSAAKGDDAVVRVLLTNGALVDQRSASGATSLFIACQSGAVAVAETLLASGADAVLADGAGATPLYVACQNGHAAAVELLLSTAVETMHKDECVEFRRISDMVSAAHRSDDARRCILFSQRRDLRHGIELDKNHCLAAVFGGRDRHTTPTEHYSVGDDLGKRKAIGIGGAIPKVERRQKTRRTASPSFLLWPRDFQASDPSLTSKP